jgi:5'-3' exonuclease
MTAAAVEQKQRVVLIDLSSLYHPAWHANENYPMVAFQATIDAVVRCTKKDPNALTAICLDSRKSWRKELAPAYKAQREKLPDVFYQTLDKVKARLRADGYLLWESEGFEADDVIGTACEEAVRRGHPVAICSSDKDLMQLLRPGVIQLRTYGEWSVWSELEVESKFGIKMSQFVDYLALVGDPSDNIKGCHRVGKGTAPEMLKAYGDWPGIVKAMEDRKFTPAITASLQDFDYNTTRKLIELRKDVPINFDAIYGVKQEEPIVEETPKIVASAEKIFGVKAETTHSEEPDTVVIGEFVDLPASTALAPVPPQQVEPTPRPSNDVFVGIAASPFPHEAQAILGAPLTDDEISVRPDDGILYMSGEAVRQRLQRAFGIGGWAIKPISTIVDREAVDKNNKPQPRVYYTGQLWILGRFVSESTGDGSWIKTNPKSDYGTALEGAKTNCISRCCKDIGMWGELRDKDFTKAWSAKNVINNPSVGYVKRPKQPINKQQQGA